MNKYNTILIMMSIFILILIFLLNKFIFTSNACLHYSLNIYLYTTISLAILTLLSAFYSKRRLSIPGEQKILFIIFTLITFVLLAHIKNIYVIHFIWLAFLVFFSLFIYGYAFDNTYILLFFCALNLIIVPIIYMVPTLSEYLGSNNYIIGISMLFILLLILSKKFKYSKLSLYIIFIFIIIINSAQYVLNVGSKECDKSI